MGPLVVILSAHEVYLGADEGDEREGAPVQTPLMRAGVCGDLESIRRLVASGAELDEANSLNETALTYAIVWSQVDAVELLLQCGADPDAPRGSPWSPLMYAADEGNRAIVEALLRSGADRRRRDDHGRSASDIAKDRGFDAVARMIAPDADLG